MSAIGLAVVVYYMVEVNAPKNLLYILQEKREISINSRTNRPANGSRVLLGRLNACDVMNFLRGEF